MIIKKLWNIFKEIFTSEYESEYICPYGECTPEYFCEQCDDFYRII